jgi:hypothetical protein
MAKNRKQNKMEVSAVGTGAPHHPPVSSTKAPRNPRNPRNPRRATNQETTNQETNNQETTNYKPDTGVATWADIVRNGS